jgi:hypothetical protein
VYKRQVVKSILNIYDNIIIPEPIPEIITKVFNYNKQWYSDENIFIGKQSDFYPNQNEINNNSFFFTIHHWEASWVKSYRDFSLKYIQDKFNHTHKNLAYRIVVISSLNWIASLNNESKTICSNQLKAFQKLYIYETYLKGPKFNPKHLYYCIKDLGISFFKELSIYQKLGLISKSLLFLRK